MMERRERSPGFKLGLAIAIGMLLAIPIFSVWFLVYDRQSQANEARTSIAAGWKERSTSDTMAAAGPASTGVVGAWLSVGGVLSSSVVGEGKREGAATGMGDAGAPGAGDVGASGAGDVSASGAGEPEASLTAMLPRISGWISHT